MSPEPQRKLTFADYLAYDRESEAQHEVRVELFERRPDDRWILSECREVDAVLDLSAVGAALALSDVYHRVPGV